MNKSIIFDLDGTVLDSMPYWTNLGKDYLTSIGITPPKNLNDIISNMTIEEACIFFREELGVNKSIDTINKEILSLITDRYRYTIMPKEEILEVINREYKNHTRMCILTTTDYNCADMALKRIGIRHCFEEILTDRIMGCNKRSKDIFLKTCQRMKYDINNTIVYEDAPFAIRAAKEAGLKVIQVYDSAWR